MPSQPFTVSSPLVASNTAGTLRPELGMPHTVPSAYTTRSICASRVTNQSLAVIWSVGL